MFSVLRDVHKGLRDTITLMEEKWSEFIEKKQKEAEEEMQKQQAIVEGPEIKSASEILSGK